ncbi:hypothetical protein OAQ87_02425, partial [Candidatus Marinimicrobia bacterium]|nr:hypothetical protein [Candidatus Neomarinimicrobiota bacterium]
MSIGGAVFVCKKNITFLILLIIFSCDKDGTVVVNPEQSEDIFVNNLSGYGCAGDNLCYSIDDVYYNFSGSDAFQIDFYKFNSYQLQSGNHNAEDPANILSLTSFNESHLIGIPTSSIVNESNQVLVSTLSCNLGNCADGGGGFVLEADCLEEWIAIDSENECNGNNGQWIEGEDPYEFEVQDIINQTLQSEETLDTTAQISLSSNPFSIIKNITWNKQQGRYNFVTETSEKKEMDFLYSQDYKNNTYTTLIDTTLNPIYGDIILVDENEDVERSYTIIDSLDNSEIRSTRRSEFKIKSTFVSDEDALMFKQSTDCNDNYRQDEEEMVLFAKYSMSTSSYANSFEGWCLAGSCSNDDFSFSEQDCCENNEGMWYQNTMSCEPYCINYSINCSAYTGSEDCLNSSKCAWENDLCISGVTETECEEVAGTWSSRPDKYSWDDSYATFNVDDEDLCSSTCIKSSE